MDVATSISFPVACDNRRIPIALLPMELLVEVFLYYTAAYRHLKPEETNNSLGTVFCIMQVCRYWRKVTLGISELWSVFTTTRPAAFVDMMLARSKKHPLAINLCLDPDSNPDEEHCRKVFSSFARIRHLHLSHVPLSFIEKFVPRSGPLLKALTLSYLSDPSGRHGGKGGLFKLENCALPALTELTIDSTYRIQWISPLLKCSLTHLCLMGCIDYSNHPGSLSVILSALEAMPLLQYLVLDKVLPWSLDQSERSNRKAQLSNLRSVNVRLVGAITCMRLFEALVFPSSTTIRLMAHDTAESQACWHSLLTTMTDKLTAQPAAAPVTPFLAACIRCRFNEDIVRRSDFMEIKIDGYHAPYPLKIANSTSCGALVPFFRPFLDNSADDSQEGFHVRFSDSYLAESVFVEVEEVLRALPICDWNLLRCLYLSGPHPAQSASRGYLQPTTETWMKYFGHMTSLRELIVEGWGVKTLPEVLAVVVESPQAEEEVPRTDKAPSMHTPKLFPLLERFTVLLPDTAHVDCEHVFTRYHTAFVIRQALGMCLQESISMYVGQPEMMPTERENVTPSETAGAHYVRYSWFPEGSDNTHIPLRLKFCPS